MQYKLKYSLKGERNPNSVDTNTDK